MTDFDPHFWRSPRLQTQQWDLPSVGDTWWSPKGLYSRDEVRGRLRLLE